MKNKIFLLVITILFLTGCSCEYNLTINDNNYKENIRIIADNEEEISYINYNWKIPTDKDEYNLVGDTGTNPNYKSDLYDYKINNNILTFDYNFNKSSYINSSAVSVCYDRLNIENHKNALIIATSIKANCFEKQPGLNKITINITVDKEVISSNSDEINGKTYTWYITKNNYSNKSITLTLSNEEKKEQENIINEQNNTSNEKESTKETKTDFSLYIFSGILLIIMLSIYFLFNKMKNKNNQMDD